MAASSTLGIALEAAIGLVAESPTFQSAVGAVDAAAAKASIYQDENPDADDDTKYPFAIVSVHPTTSFSPIASGCVNVALHLVAVVLVEFVALADVNAAEGTYLDFVDTFGQIMEDMSGLMNGEKDTYGFTRISIESAPMRTDPSNRNQQDIFYASATFGRDAPT